MSKILTQNYSELLLITEHCSINLKPNIIFIYLFIFWLRGIYILNLEAINGEVVAMSLKEYKLVASELKLLPSKIHWSRTSKPKRHWTRNPLRLRSVAADMEVEFDNEVI